MPRRTRHSLARRDLLRLSAGGLALPGTLGLAGLLGSGARALASSSSNRRFLFVFCTGGWDPTECLAPMLGTVVENLATVREAEANGLSYVTADDRPMVDAFFQTWGDQTALVHGMEARSVAHDVCLRLMLTGSTLPDGDDWPSILADASDQDLLTPMLHVSGPSYTGSLASEVVRVGASGQLSALLSGGALEGSAQVVQALPGDVQALADQLVSARISARTASASAGRALEIAQLSEVSDARLHELLAVAADLDLSGGEDFAAQAITLAELFERGLARCGVVEFYGTLGLSWDTHAAHHLQGTHFNTLMEGLDRILADLASRAGTAEGSTLLDETTVVVLSEMGRYPKLNSREGKEHWTYTSAMLLGSGIRGGTSVGGYHPERFTGLRVDPDSGEQDDGGEALVPDHLGATLLTLAGSPTSPHTGETPPLTALLS